jgi:hypothetical protein
MNTFDSIGFNFDMLCHTCMLRNYKSALSIVKFKRYVIRERYFTVILPEEGVQIINSICAFLQTGEDPFYTYSNLLWLSTIWQVASLFQTDLHSSF